VHRLLHTVLCSQNVLRVEVERNDAERDRLPCAHIGTHRVALQLTTGMTTRYSRELRQAGAGFEQTGDEEGDGATQQSWKIRCMWPWAW
jgi:hypothetical protein